MVDQQKIIEAIAEILTLPASDLDMEASLQDDLSLNPVEVADLLHSLAAKFRITLEPQETEGIKTVSNLVETIEDKLLE